MLSILSVPIASRLCLRRGLMVRAAPRLSFEFGASMLDHPEKKGGGEDSFFKSSLGKSLGVADGVGGWADDVRGSARDYARALCRQAQSLSEARPMPTGLQLLSDAYNTVPEGVEGAATFVVAVLTSHGLSLAWVGDSAALVLRRTVGEYNVIFRSNEQQHSFNFPFQLSTAPESDGPGSADQALVDVHEDDLIILASDGLFDNLFDEEIVAIVSEADDRAPANLDALARRLASTAQDRAGIMSLSTRGRAALQPTPTPFEVSARSKGMDFVGGKLDDTTVVCARVVRVPL
jgi:protein phosphatase PTC7